MTRENFTAFVEKTIEEAIALGESTTGLKLPREISFAWLSEWTKEHSASRENVVSRIVDRVFQGEEQIFPCVDLGVADLLSDGTPVLVASIAGYAPRPFGTNWTGREGPFVLIVGSALQARARGETPKQVPSFGYSIPKFKGKQHA